MQSRFTARIGGLRIDCWEDTDVELVLAAERERNARPDGSGSVRAERSSHAPEFTEFAERAAMRVRLVVMSE